MNLYDNQPLTVAELRRLQALENRYRNAAREVFTNRVEYDETYYINGEEILLPQLTQEQVDRIVSFVESVNKRGYYNEAISNIISEEAGAYFSGQKSARDVAGVIQSRVQVYVNENR